MSKTAQYVICLLLIWSMGVGVRGVCVCGFFVCFFFFFFFFFCFFGGVVVVVVVVGGGGGGGGAAGMSPMIACATVCPVIDERYDYIYLIWND